MALFSCKACSCKDAHINDLRDQIENYSKLVFSKMAETPQVQTPDVYREQDFVLAGGGNDTTRQPTEDEEAINQEAIKIFTAQYDNYPY